MSILIVYDSIFGNTAQIARAMADALTSSHEVKLASVQEARDIDLSGVDLLIVGSPTRGFRPTPEIQEFASRPDLSGRAAAFDTRIDLDTIHPAPLRWVVSAGGYAAERLSGELRDQGCTLVGEPAGFVVLGQEGPLKDGEAERAAAWARDLVAAPPTS
ncbi:flavodoxin domain-containing protein [uncultured Devosia sp.]|uniref:flavodoxin family protein n=1 Tax=uncultured Devosia sp. TaxID=211434 RepID=UPI00263781AC|nr:flavodoxin domain-containing protein [uncultured Devosia sp.]